MWLMWINVYVVNGLQSEDKIPITLEIQYLVRKEQTAVTLSLFLESYGPMVRLESYGPMVRKVDVNKFCNSS